MSWMIRADQLDNEQEHFVFEEVKDKGNKWLQGFPGTGKSVLLIHLILDKIEEDPNIFICVVVFTNALKDMFSAAMKESGIPYGNVYLTTYHQFIKENFKYEYIFCDEVQDLPQTVLEKMKARTKQLIVAGDANQSIYEEDPYSHEKVIKVSNLNNIINAKPYELETIHRLTKSIIKSVSFLLPEMNIESAKSSRKTEDTSIRLVKGESETQEIEYILDEAKKAIDNDESTVILLPSHKDIADFIEIVLSLNNQNIDEIPKNRWNKVDYNKINSLFESNHINLQYLGNGYGDLYNANKSGKIIFMTYHSSKGLDFDNVFLPFISRDFENLYISVELKKTLFMVGMTRSKKNLYLTYAGHVPSNIQKFEHICTKVDINKCVINNLDNESDFEF